ncbi:WD40 repeat domain-containing protein [Candidatus Poribacteria bacterium]|nr:WD40 repeat domain-containing protein [Candidatus Poribacteria bacterium]
MKKRITTLILLTILTTPLFAQDQLPEGAKIRIGKGRADELDYSTDGSRLAVGSTIGVWIYDTHTYKPINLLTENKSPIRHLAYSSNGINLVYADFFGHIFIWNTNTGEYTRPLNNSNRLQSMAISPNGKNLVVADWTNKIRTWDIATGKEIMSFDKENNKLNANIRDRWAIINSLAISPDGSLLATGNRLNNIHLVDAFTGRIKFVIKEHKRPVNSIAFSSDGNTLASGSLDGNVILWDPLTGTQKATFRHDNVSILANVVFSPDGSLLACSGVTYSNADIYLLDPNTATLKKTLTGHRFNLHDIAFSPDLRTLASGGWDGTVRIWEVATGKNTHTIPGHFGEFSCFTWSLDGNTIITPYLLTIHFWDSKTGEIQKTITPDWYGNAADIASSPDGKTLAVIGSVFGYVHNMETGQTTKLKEHTDFVHCVAYSPDSKTVATGSRDKTVRLWDTQTGKLKRTFNKHKDEITTIAFSPDGKWSQVVVRKPKCCYGIQRRVN